MISTKKLQKLARKWQKLAAIKRKRITLLQADGVTETRSCSTSTKAEKGHFVVYSADQKRFVLPLHYLQNEMIREMLNTAEDEFGWCGNGPLTLPCEAGLIEYVISLIRQKANRDVQKAASTSIARSCASSRLQHQPIFHQLPVYSF